MNIDPRPDHGSIAAQHPADRPTEPDYPMILDGGVVPGDADLMARCMLEELLQVGIGPKRLVAMTRDPNYQALFAARRMLGDVRMDALIDGVLARVGQHHYHTVEHGGDVQAVPLSIGRTE